ncbi:hypothetical protein KKC91_09535 [bacterium]|nr:hypothetical protein [bacterium]
MKKHLTLKDVLKEELKDSEFKKFYEEEGQRLALGYKIAKLRQKQGLKRDDKG